MNRLISNILDTDSYKLSHWVQYPPKTTAMFSYLESRGGRFPNTMFFGLQYYLKEYLSKPITLEEIEEARQFAQAHGEPFNYSGWRSLLRKHGGYIPIKIRAVPEGYIIPTRNILMSVESTDPEFFWVVSWFETMLVRLWYPITVATQSWHIKQKILQFLRETSDQNPEQEVLFKLHDFGSRGVSSQESAMIGGMAHLVNFMGSDTIAGVVGANHYYNGTMAGFSIPASEHSTMTMWGKDNEVEAFRNMIQCYGDEPIFACVSDSYDIYNAVDNLWGQLLKHDLDRMKAILVVRPDSGDPVTVCRNVVRKLDSRFGSTTNSKGYRVLNGVRIIQGDGVNLESIVDILQAFKGIGYSAENIAFGMGGALLQKLDRDTQKFAFKCSWAKVNGQDINVFKQPVTSEMKASKAGRLDLELFDNVHICTVHETSKSLMVDVFRNGNILKEYSLDEIRENSNKEFKQYKGWRDKGYLH